MLKKKKGFTLIEVLITVLLVAILGAVALPVYTITVERTRVSTSISLLKPIYDSVFHYYTHHDDFPDTLKKLSVSVPDYYSVDGLTATSEDGLCTVTLNTGIPAMQMTCGKTNSPEYMLEFRYTVNANTASLAKAGEYFKIVATNSDRVSVYEKVAGSSGWGAAGDGYYTIND